MSAGYYKDKSENVKVSLLISNLIRSVLSLPPSRITGLSFLSVNNRRLEPCNAWGRDFKVYKYTYFDG